jgi:hypothetical protein
MRWAVKGQPARPELRIPKENHEVPVPTAHYFLRERHIQKCPQRFNVVASGMLRASHPSFDCIKPHSARNCHADSSGLG